MAARASRLTACRPGCCASAKKLESRMARLSSRICRRPMAALTASGSSGGGENGFEDQRQGIERNTRRAARRQSDILRFDPAAGPAASLLSADGGKALHFECIHALHRVIEHDQRRSIENGIAESDRPVTPLAAGGLPAVGAPIVDRSPVAARPARSWRRRSRRVTACSGVPGRLPRWRIMPARLRRDDVRAIR